MKRNYLIISIIVLCATFASNFLSRLYIHNSRKAIQLSYKSPQMLLPPVIMKMAVGEFKGLWADYMLLEVSSFEGSNEIRTAEDYLNIFKGLKISLMLDPYFQHTYMLAQGILPWRAKMAAETNELLDVSRRHRPWDWRPGHYMGFNYSYFFQDYAKASEILLETANIKGAPVLLAILGSRFAMKSERTQAAITILKKMIEDEAVSSPDRLDIEMRISALQGVLQLERAIEQYRKHNGNNPSQLEDLLESGFLLEIPPNPYADSFYYDSQNGKVFF